METPMIGSKSFTEILLEFMNSEPNPTYGFLLYEVVLFQVQVLIARLALDETKAEKIFRRSSKW